MDIFRNLLILVIFCYIVMLTGCDTPKGPGTTTHVPTKITEQGVMLSSGISEEDLAYHWAPVHYQDINPAGNDNSRVDYITRLDKNGEWNPARYFWNDKKLSTSLPAYVYYSVVVSDSHYFITYSFFHPWDTYVYNGPEYDPPFDIEQVRERNGWDKSDLEGVLFVIKRNPDNAFGTLEVVFSQAHGYLHAYFPPTVKDSALFNLKKCRRVRPNIFLHYSHEAEKSMGDSVARVITTQEEGGHGAGCYPDWGAPSCGDPRYLAYSSSVHPGGGDHIRYIPSRDSAEEPNYRDIYFDKDGNEKKGLDRYTVCTYKLINLFSSDGGLWYHRDQSKVFTADYNFIAHGGTLWNWRGDKDETNTQFYFAEALHLTPAERALVHRAAKPFTHNPAQLCWVYLSLTDGIDSKKYFSADYEYNGFAHANIQVSHNRMFEVEIIPAHFGPVQPVKKTITIKNIGEHPLTLDTRRIKVWGSNKFRIDCSKLKQKLSEMESLTLDVTFFTDDVDNVYQTGISMLNDSYKSEYTYVVEGRGVVKPFIFRGDVIKTDTSRISTGDLPDSIIDELSAVIWQYEYNDTSRFPMDMLLKPTLESFGVWDFPDSPDVACIAMQDMTGDGLADSVLQFESNGEHCWQILPSGATEGGGLLTSTRIPGVKCIAVKDVTGDGLADLVLRFKRKHISHWQIRAMNPLYFRK